MNTKNGFMVFDCKKQSFKYSQEMVEMFSANFDSRPFWQIASEAGIMVDSVDFQNEVRRIAESEKPEVNYKDYSMVNKDGQLTHYNIGFISTVPHSEIIITLSEKESKYELKNDTLTGLLNLETFSKKLDGFLNSLSDDDTISSTLVYFDVQRFKVINDMFGMSEGDRLLKHISYVITNAVRDKGLCCRINSDKFVFVIEFPQDKRTEILNKIFDDIADYDIPFEIACNAGIYTINNNKLSSTSIIDRAIMAQSSVKGNYTNRFGYYREELRNDLISEQEITGMMKQALAEEQFVAYYQPQYNHSTGMIVGAEALVRWIHPEKGLISPGRFIPVFEKNGFISNLDLYVFEKVCKFIRKCLDNGFSVVPISTNLTRHDIFNPNFIDNLERVRAKYNVPSKYTRIEITESAALGNSDFINEAVRKLHSFGYVVEMDDFGSGYSSLNILKDIDFDIIKLDMKFLHSDKEESSNHRGGTVLSSVVRMMNWLKLPVIAEGVETVEQADFLRSIGCEYIQGYLYSRPLKEEDYEKLVSGNSLGATIPQMKLIESLNSANFWSSDSLETLIFSNFVGGAAIFDYKDGKMEILRVNQKYLEEFGMNLSEKDLVKLDLMDFLDESDKAEYMKMLEAAIETGEEQECETWYNITSSCCGEERICIRNTVRMIGESKQNYLFYTMIRNITAEKNRIAGLMNSEKCFQVAIEHANVYFWEYTIATREMRPCYRCMRDLGFPAVLRNYPDSAIEMGVFPPEVADEYRDWHRQMAEGAKSFEKVMPLTVGRIPFRVRYTTEFDENGTPIKAYGSATLIGE